MDNDDIEFEEHPRSSLSTHSLTDPSVSIPRKSRSRDPHFPRRNPNLNRHENSDDDDLNGGFYAVPKKKRRLPSHGFEESWSERAILVLLEVWGDNFVRLGRRSLRAEEWREVAERVSEATRVERTEAQCRTMLDSLKNKYKKERERVELSGYPSNWGLFRKMESFLELEFGGGGLACGVDSGEFVFADMRVYLDQANGFDEMRDSPAESEVSGDDNGGGVGRESDDSDGPPCRQGGAEDGPFRVLADSIERFGDIYDRVESQKRRQMIELESMRMDFQRELELQKRVIMERTRAEIARIRAGGEDEDLGR